MAATYGRHTGKTGVCIATLGPGATNFVTAAAYAQLGGMPMLMITGQKPIKKSKQGRFQILDVCAMMTPITKFTHQMHSADNIPSRVREAFRIAEEEKPGAVHIELPEDIADEHTDSVPLHRSHSRRPNADAKSIREAVKALESAKSPLLVIGAGANRTMTSRMLLQFIEKTGIPFLTTQLGKGVIDERHPKFLGCAALSAGDFVHRAVEASDCIVNIGHDVIEKPPFFMREGGPTVIHVSTKTAEVDPVYFPHIEVIGDIANAIWQMKEDIVPSGSCTSMCGHHFSELFQDDPAQLARVKALEARVYEFSRFLTDVAEAGDPLLGMANMDRYRDMTPISAAYDELSASGDLALIRSPQVLNALSLYNGVVIFHDRARQEYLDRTPSVRALVSPYARVVYDPAAALGHTAEIDWAAAGEDQILVNAVHQTMGDQLAFGERRTVILNQVRLLCEALAKETGKPCAPPDWVGMEKRGELTP